MLSANLVCFLFVGKALCDAGETYKMMADVKYALEDNVKQNFLDPLTHLQNNDLKEVAVGFLFYFYCFFGAFLVKFWLVYFF